MFDLGFSVTVKHASTVVGGPKLVSCDAIVIHLMVPDIGWLFDTELKSVLPFKLGQVNPVWNLRAIHLAQEWRREDDILGVSHATVTAQFGPGNERLGPEDFLVLILGDLAIGLFHFCQTGHHVASLVRFLGEGCFAVGHAENVGGGIVVATISLVHLSNRPLGSRNFGSLTRTFARREGRV